MLHIALIHAEYYFMLEGLLHVCMRYYSIKYQCPSFSPDKCYKYHTVRQIQVTVHLHGSTQRRKT